MNVTSHHSGQHASQRSASDRLKADGILGLTESERTVAVSVGERGGRPQGCERMSRRP
jgi:hypothetical protein